MNTTPETLNVKRLGEARVASPLRSKGRVTFVEDSQRVEIFDQGEPGTGAHLTRSFELAGPRASLYFDPGEATVAMVTCGGVSPGLNNVIRSAYFQLTANYGVQRVIGIRNGYRGLTDAIDSEPMALSRRDVQYIHDRGGTMLGSSRGHQDPGEMVDTLERLEIDALLCIGGDGTQRAAHKIAQEVERRGLRKAIVGVPKTIDNDIPHVQMSFGHITAIDRAVEVLRAAHTEALAVPHGVGLVKLMGRDAGFIAAGAAVASQDANFVLVPEVRFPLEGEHGFLTALERRVEDRGHALVVVAEGAGQHLFDQPKEVRDASGNIQHEDIGTYLRDRIREHFTSRGLVAHLKYIDPSYLIRGVPPNAWDRMLSDRMARSAVHAALAGRTDTLIGYGQSLLIHVPIRAAVDTKRTMPVTSDLWRAVLSTTEQPHW